MTTIIEHKDALVEVEELAGGLRRIAVKMRDVRRFSPRLQWETSYSQELIEALLLIKGPAYLCDEIAREEDPLYTQSDLSLSLLAYVPKDRFDGKSILDFGCGAGASTVIIGRMFPRSRVIGVDLDEMSLSVARLRAKHRGLPNLAFMRCPSPTSLPEDTAEIDYIVMSAVYEHLLPAERPALLLQLWGSLAQGGVLFINQTPDRRFPIEAHTTGLPLLNYLPDPVASLLARRFSKRVRRSTSWISLLRNGVRGATPSEIIRILARSGQSPELLSPIAEGIVRQSQIWYCAARGRLSNRLSGARRSIVVSALSILPWMGLPVAPYLSIAIRKSGGSRQTARSR